MSASIFAPAPAYASSNRIPIRSWPAQWSIPLRKINIKSVADIRHKLFGACFVTLSCAGDNSIVRLLLGYPITEAQYVFKDTQTLVSFAHSGFVIHCNLRLLNFNIK